MRAFILAVVVAAPLGACANLQTAANDADWLRNGKSNSDRRPAGRRGTLHSDETNASEPDLGPKRLTPVLALSPRPFLPRLILD
jgi:hypothetical protein